MMLGIQVTQPWSLLWLAGAAPLVLLSRRSLAGLEPRRAALALALRLAVYALLVGALAGTQVVRPVKGTGVIFLLDRSESVAEADRDRAVRFVNQATATMGPDDLAGVVVFGRGALVEQAPRARLELAAVESGLDGSFTDISAALRLAIATLPTDRRPRLVLLSDGNENLGDALGEARTARGGGVPIDVVALRRAPAREVVAERLLVPGEARAGDTVEPRLVVRSDAAGEATVGLLRDNQPVGRRTVTLTPGKNVVAFEPLAIDEGGFHAFTATVESELDGDERNNRALGFTYVAGRHKVLYVERDADQAHYLANALRRAGLEVVATGPEGLPTNLPALGGYDCLLLSNISALDVADAQMTMIHSAVRDLGMGFVMIGGDESFGVGGYYQTEIEEILPVDMDIRKQRFLPNVGVAIVIDQSGSMTMTEGGHQKIQLANEAAIAAVSVLSERDQVTVIATDSRAKPVTGPAMVPITSKQLLIDRIAGIRAGGNGIYCREGLAKAAELIRPADCKLKHIILFADAADSEQQEGCRELVSQLAGEKITTTVVGLGRESDPDVAFLKDIARLGQGRFYLTHRAGDLPRIFTREAILASRSQVIEEPFTPLLQTDLPMLRGIEAVPQLRGYVATTAKPPAEVGLISDSKHKDPILAAWQYGLGRTVAFTSDCKARWSADWVGWSGYPKFWSQLVRWTIRRVQRGNFETRVITRFQADADEVARYRLKRGEAKVLVDAVDRQGRFINGLALTGTAIAPDGTGVELRLEQTGPGRYEASFRTEQVGIYVVNVGGGEGADAGSQTVGVAISYPPEYGDTASRDSLLARMAQVSGGAELERPDEVFTPRGAEARAAQDIWAILLGLALFLFPIDVAVRRLLLDRRRVAEIVARLRGRLRPRAEEPRATEGLLASKERARERLTRLPSAPAVRPARPAAAPPLEPTEAGEPEPEPAPRDTLSRLRAAREARQRGEAPAEPTGPRPSAPAEPRPSGETSASLERLKRARERSRRLSQPRDDEPDV